MKERTEGYSYADDTDSSAAVVQRTVPKPRPSEGVFTGAGEGELKSAPELKAMIAHYGAPVVDGLLGRVEQRYRALIEAGHDAKRCVQRMEAINALRMQIGLTPPPKLSLYNDDGSRKSFANLLAMVRFYGRRMVDALLQTEERRVREAAKFEWSKDSAVAASVDEVRDLRDNLQKSSEAP